LQPTARKGNVMHLLQNLKQKSVARKSMILLAAITLSAAVATNALAAGDGGGGVLGGVGGFGGGHIGGGGGFAAGHIGVGSAGGRIVGDRPGGHRDAYLGNRGVDNLHGTHMGGGHYGRDHDRDHDRDHHFRNRFVVVPGYDDYYDDYDYGLGDYAGDSACFQYRHVHTTAGWQWRQVWVCN